MPTPPTPLVFNVQKFSVHDGPGIRTLVFFKGCPLRCRWCSNPESQSREPEVAFNAAHCIGCGECAQRCTAGAVYMDGARPVLDRKCCSPGPTCLCERCCPGSALKIYGKPISVPHLVELCRQDEQFYNRSGGGITLGGGEPLFQPAEAVALLTAAKACRLHTTMETCGYARTEDMLQAAALLDCLYYDIKCMDTHRHKRFTGVSNDLIHKNLTLVREIYPLLPVRVRTPVVPGFNDIEPELLRIARFVKSLGVMDYELLPYHSFGEQKYSLLDRKAGMPPVTLDERHFADLHRAILAEMTA